MTPLREKMINDMQLYRLASTTQDSYLRSVKGLAKYFSMSPDKIDEDKLKEYILYLINERSLKWSSINIITAGLRFFYIKTLNRKDLALSIPIKKTPSRLPEIFSPDELIMFFSNIRNLKHRMMIRIEKGKGSRDRYTILSPKLLEELRSYWKRYRPKYWLFTNEKTKRHITKSCPHLAFERARKKLGIKKQVTFHSLKTQLRNTYA